MSRGHGSVPVASALKTVVGLALIALVGASALALLARFGWPFELFVHFRPQYVVFAVAAAIACALLRRPLVATICLVVAMLNALLAWFAAAPAPLAATCTSGPLITVATANLWFRNQQTSAALEWLEASQADLVIVQEVTPRWASALRRLSGFPHREFHPRPDPYGIGVLSAHPLESVVLRDFAGDGIASLDVELTIEGRRLRLLGLHTHWPLHPTTAQLRDVGLAKAADLAHAARQPVIVAGDFNLTPWAPAFAQFLERSGLYDPLGRSLRSTWLAGFWPLALRIDHVLVPAGFCTVAAQVGPDLGSDHRPVIVSLRRAE